MTEARKAAFERAKQKREENIKLKNDFPDLRTYFPNLLH